VKKIEFNPPLPEGKRLLGENLVPGHAVKVVAAFKHAFWLENQNSSAQSSSQGSQRHFTELGPMHNLFHAVLKGDVPALVGLITGDVAEEMERLPSEADRKKAVLDQLTAMYFGGDQKQVRAEPIFYADKAWAKEEWSGGCFAGIASPNGSLVKYGEHIRKEMDLMHFCSTETSPQFYGYMEGAVRSGQRAGKEVVKHLLS